MKTRGCILLVDDEANHRFMLRMHLEDAGYRIREAAQGAQALQVLRQHGDVDLIVLDLRMDVMDGMSFLVQARQSSLGIPVVMLSAYSDVPTAVEALKLGAVDFLTKPVDIEALLELIERQLQSESDTAVAGQSPQVDLDYEFEGVWSAEGMGRIIELLAMVAPTDASVLILGESGTGKELVARSIHRNSPRASGPFVAVNCAALSETLIESELFGHEKGAFTGATARKPGRFEQAEGGTLFLDEIGEMPLQAQAKLLRALQEKLIERLGGTRSIAVDVRILAATNRDLESMVAEGAFREDLFFRLNLFPVQVPALRERRSEIRPLAEHFMERAAARYGRLVRSCTPEFYEALERYEFPGNVRELQNLVERAVILCRDAALDVGQLPELLSKSATHATHAPEASDAVLPESSEAAVSVSLRDNQRQLIVEALQQSDGNKSRAARELGIARRTLHNKIREYGIQESEYR